MAFDLSLSHTTLDRGSELRRDPGLLPRLLADPATGVLELHGDRFPVSDDGKSLRLRPPAPGDADELVVYLGEVSGRSVICVVLPRDDDSNDLADLATLRQVGASLGPNHIGIAVTAIGIANWHAAQGFCSFSGHATEVGEAGWLRHCPGCGRNHYPRTDPAVIMSVVDADDRILLGRGHNFAGKGMSVLAGFVEPGESLEAAVAREVMEEVGVPVTDVQFLGDQPWPFPASLMIGFTCRATATKLTLDPVEIADARWFTRTELADAVADGELRLSPRLSIARHLIEHWYGGAIDQPAGDPFLRSAR
ncbi:NAD(+) diphosphatase [Flexivirga sp. ID2601S]|uniref:NAD(+) diphosphatase n=1 Tax=Flexivirga aerilata TaxID=1656889 RepID=A0A849AIN2_9MICO|nr:NAD(+) diphosphatase [Flexivirga aerilata]NNG39191.1 NAD(+) diphosphatase [Flexivirga aerilata]